MKNVLIFALCAAGFVATHSAFAGNGDMFDNKRPAVESDRNYDYTYRSDMFPQQATYQSPRNDLFGSAPHQSYPGDMFSAHRSAPPPPPLAPGPSLPSEYR